MVSSLAAIALSAMLAIDHPVETRDECIDEATARWAMIARVIGRIAEHPPEEWRWAPIQLIRSSVTIAEHESRFRRDVHIGKKRGGGAVCLTQIDPAVAAMFDWQPESLVGVNEEATERCFRAEVVILAKARSMAEHRCSGGHWFAPSVALYGSGKGCVPTGKWAAGVEARERTYIRTGARKQLPAFMLEMVEES